MTDAKLQCAVRDKVGSRDSRRLRAQGRMVASLQADADHPHVNLHFDEADFNAARRHHVHLFDLDLAGNVESAIVNELQWDALGDRLMHVEFKRVVRGQKTESIVPLEFVGNPAGILTHDFNEVHIMCIPSLIPDSIKVNVDGLEPGTHVKPADIEMPEGIELVIDADVDIAVISELKEESTTPAEGADDVDPDPTAPAADDTPSEG